MTAKKHKLFGGIMEMISKLWQMLHKSITTQNSLNVHFYVNELNDV